MEEDLEAKIKMSKKEKVTLMIWRNKKKLKNKKSPNLNNELFNLNFVSFYNSANSKR